MKNKFILFLILLSLPLISFGAVAVTNSDSTQTTGTTGTSFNWSYNHTSGNAIIIGIALASPSDRINAVTFGGQTATRIRTDMQGNDRTYLYYFATSTAGANTVHLGLTVDSALQLAAISFSGVNATGTDSGATSTGASISATSTTIGTNSLLVNIMMREDSTQASSTSNDTLQLYNHANPAGYPIMLLSTKTTTGTGSYSMSYNQNTTGLDSTISMIELQSTQATSNRKIRGIGVSR